MMALGDPRGDDADHARVPALGGQHQRPALGMLRHERLGLEADPGLDVATLGVDPVQLGGDRLRAVPVLSEQQLEPGVGAVKPPGGVQARAEPEADRRLVQARGIDARDVHQRPQPDLARAGERPQPLAHEPAVLALQRHDVRHGRERDQVQILVGQRRVLPRALQQRLRELVGDAGGAQVRARVAVDARVHERRVRQHAVGARRVMVGDHDVHPQRAGERDLLDRGDRAVDRDQQVGPARGQLLDRRAREPVAVVDPARQVPVHVRAQRAQRAHEDRGRAHAVDVVVPVDGDPRAALDVLEHAPCRRRQAGPGTERVALAGGQEGPCRLRLPQAAAHEHLRDDVRAAQLGGQPRGGGEGVRGDLQARVHDALRLGAREDGNRAHSEGNGSSGLPRRLLRARGRRAAGRRRSSTTPRSRRCATSTATSASTGACSTWAAPRRTTSTCRPTS